MEHQRRKEAHKHTQNATFVDTKCHFCLTRSPLVRVLKNWIFLSILIVLPSGVARGAEGGTFWGRNFAN